jgi:pimeloyl-ACP methyl ester carboxylesterase
VVEHPRFDDQYVRVDGGRIRYWAQGEGEALILVHGLAGSVEFWQYNVEPLAAAHRVYALDLPGFGGSDKEIEHLSLEYAASFLTHFMDVMGLERASLAGNSLGGLVCAQTAVRSPERVVKLILVGSAGFGGELNLILRLWSVPLLGDLVFRTYQRAFPSLRRWAFPDSPSIDDQWMAAAATVLRTPGVRESALRIARMGASLRGQRQEMLADLHRQVAGIDVPTLIIWGRQDPVVPVAHAYAARDLIPHSEVRIIERCGHIPQVERPEEFNKLVLDFLASTSPAK